MWNGGCAVASKPAPVVICDAGPLIHLDVLRCLALLIAFGDVLVPEVVWLEVRQHRPSALRRRRVALTRVKNIPQPDKKLVVLLEALPLDPGEEQALCLMREFPEALLLTDDGAARATAQQLGYEVHGTIGILLLGYRQGRRSRRQILNSLAAIPQKSTLHVAKDLLNAIIAQI